MHVCVRACVCGCVCVHEFSVFVVEGRSEAHHLVQQHAKAPPINAHAILLTCCVSCVVCVVCCMSCMSCGYVCRVSCGFVCCVLCAPQLHQSTPTPYF